MTTRSTPTQELGERIAALTASFEAEKDYQHDRWHKLANDLTPLSSLPERLTREVGRLHGLIDGKMSTLSRDFERSTEATIARAVEPIARDVLQLREDVENLKQERQRWTGARIFALWLLSTVLSIAAAFGVSWHK
jgi:hypothetical protein